MSPCFRVMLLVVLLPLACGERSVPVLDAGTTAPDSTVIDAVPSTDGVSPTVDVAIVPDKTLPPDLPPLPDSSSPTCCQPLVCVNQGTKSEGWYDPCTKKLIKYEYCSGCEQGCKDCGTYCNGNGYYTFCPTLKRLSACACKACTPKCNHIGSWSEGWYDGCTGKLITYTICSKCKLTCIDPKQPRMGVAQPRYYSTCDMNKPLTHTLCIP